MLIFGIRVMKMLVFPDNAPVSKGLMGCMFLTCTALNVPLFAHFRKYLICKLPDAFLKGEVGNVELWNSLILKFFSLVTINSFSMVHVSDTLLYLMLCYIVRKNVIDRWNVILYLYIQYYYFCHGHSVIFHNYKCTDRRFPLFQIWRIASAKISFVDTKDLVCGSLLIYYFRLVFTLIECIIL